MESWKLFEDKVTEALVAILVFVASAMIAFFRKLPVRYKQAYRRNKRLIDLKKGSDINNVMRSLSINSGAVLIHVIKYSNGGPYKMTVEWEGLGSICSLCAEEGCPNWKGVRPVQGEWEKARVTEIWHEVISKTIRFDGKINMVTEDSLDAIYSELKDTIGSHLKDGSRLKETLNLAKAIWKSSNISVYKETLLVHKANKDSWTLGLSFCDKNNNNEDGINLKIEMASRKLRKLL